LSHSLLNWLKKKISNAKHKNLQHSRPKNEKLFLEKGFVEVPTQSRTSILAACENPHSVSTYTFDGVVWPLPQTGQMWLELELLKNPNWPGVFCISTSYRDEKNPIPGRHQKIFPMFEFESKGGMTELKKLEEELLVYLGFGKPAEVIYDEICKEYGGVEILEDEHESRMWKKLGHNISLQEFPLRTNPFWNMASRGDGTFNKIDVILYGQETIGSAMRSSNVEEMRHMFYTIADGSYSAKLFELFGKDRVEKELEEFLSLNFFERFGGGIGMTRLARAYEMLIEEKESKSIKC